MESPPVTSTYMSAQSPAQIVVLFAYKLTSRGQSSIINCVSVDKFHILLHSSVKKLSKYILYIPLSFNQGIRFICPPTYICDVAIESQCMSWSNSTFNVVVLQVGVDGRVIVGGNGTAISVSQYNSNPSSATF